MNMNMSTKLFVAVLFNLFLPAVKRERLMLCKRRMALRGFTKISVLVRWKGNYQKKALVPNCVFLLTTRVSNEITDG